MTNKQLNSTYISLKNDMVNNIQTLEGLLLQEQFLLECFEDGSLQLDSHGRNHKGEYVNKNQIISNIENLKATIENLKNTMSNFSISSSVYM